MLMDQITSSDEQELGRKLFNCMSDLYPICRSITGKGVRDTLLRLNEVVPLTVHEIPSGTEVFDWKVPNEWNIRDAWIKDAQGNRVIDFQKSNLHVLNYSVPFHGRMSLSKLRNHLFALPEQPDCIPYRTSYYQENWGFCLSQNQLDELADGEYEVCIDSTLKPGFLTYGEVFVAGNSEDEILVSSHVCHPSLANDNLSGMVIAAYLARYLQTQPVRYSYRFLFIPATIGSITWLALNEEKVSKIKHGLVLACLGDSGYMTYKRSRQGNCLIDRAVIQVLKQQGDFEIFDFSPYGYDERQYCSPGFNLPVGRLSRTPHGRFPEYHTSADNLGFVSPEQLSGSLTTCLEIFDIIENDRTYLNQNPKCEPLLSKYDLYQTIGGSEEVPRFQMALLWVLNFSDSKFTLLDIAEKSGLKFQDIALAAEALRHHGLLKDLSD